MYVRMKATGPQAGNPGKARMGGYSGRGRESPLLWVESSTKELIQWYDSSS